MLAEIARSSLATSDWSDSITRSALEGAPTLQPLAQLVTSSQNVRKETNLADLKENYIRNRIDDQLRFFENKAKAAALDRQRLSRYVTRSLDGALCLAVLGLWLGFSERCRWLLSVANSDLVLALAGACLPLIAILMQSLSSYLELNRRAGRYAQQWEYLAKARNDLLAASNFSEATSIVHTTERVLLSEIIEWFYQAEHAEVFYRSAGAPVNLTPREQLTSVPEGRWTLWLTRMLDGMGMALNVTGRLIFGRVLLIALTSVLTSLLIFSRAPQDIVQRTLLRTADGQLLSHTGPLGFWDPKPEEAKRGFLLIAHGLHDSALQAESAPSIGPNSDLHWMSALQQAIRVQLGADQVPDICLVDWSLAAKPTETIQLLKVLSFNDESNLITTRMQFTADVVAIRSQAQAIGDMVGIKLAQALKADPPRLHVNQPMHLIGHSAGGFLVVRAALTLQEIGVLPRQTRVTLLDTPFPAVDDLNKLLSGVNAPQVDYYKSSAFAQMVPEDKTWSNYRCFTITPSDQYSHSATAAHSYAHQWFIFTVKQPHFDPSDAQGFQLSPFMNRRN